MPGAEMDPLGARPMGSSSTRKASDVADRRKREKAKRKQKRKNRKKR